jgi:HD-GYP domain-containing protein (c-di-GMP phosphodiesterase class II)
MELEEERALVLTAPTAEALAELDQALKVNFGMSLALLTSEGEIAYPDSDPAGLPHDADLRRLFSHTVSEVEDASLPFGENGTAHVVGVRDMRNLLGTLVGYSDNGKPVSDGESERANVFGILRAFASMAAEVSSKEIAVDSLSDELARRYEDLTLVYELADHMEVGKEAESRVEAIIKTATQRLELDFLILFGPITQRRRIYRASKGSGRLGRAERAALYKLESHVRSIVLADEEHVVINNLREDGRFAYLDGICSHVLSVPVHVSDEEIGAITVVRNLGKERFFMGDVKLISALAKQVAIVTRNARLFREVRSLFLNLVKSLISIVEAKHKYTKGHSERVHEISCFLGKHLGLRKKARDVLHWASLFHDVGKISVPDVILNKPGKLTEEEFAIIRQHPVVGHNVLSHIEQLREALPGIRHHHEKLDGSGYPDGLAGDQIPFTARIIAVADVYDALTSTRSYRPAMPTKKALDIMREGSGNHFDPRVLQVFLRKHDEIARMLDSINASAIAV